jgi:DNA-binding CsgD family transcriptional regulator
VLQVQWPLVGRDAELAQIAALLADPAAPGMVLAGPSGVGKTRLGVECLNSAKREVVRVSATRAAASVPLGAFAPYLPADGLVDSPDFNSLRIAADALVAGANDKGPPVIFVDDAHALDDASAALLHHLATHRRAFLLITFRTGEPLADALRDLWKDLLPRIDLNPFDLHEVVMLLEAELGSGIDGASAFAIHHACRGNALFLRELLSGLIESGALEDAGGMWTLRGEITAPPTIVELVSDRLNDLTGRERFVLETLALAEPMGLPVIEGLGWAGEWDSLERKGLAEVRRSRRRQQLFVSHPLHAEVLRATITTRRKNLILKESANATAKFNLRRRDDARRIALWRLEAGEPADSAVLYAAARDARLASDNKTAARLARASFEAGGGSPAGLVLGLALDDTGDHEAAEEVLREAEREADNPHDLMLAALARSGNLFRGLGRPDEANFVVLEAEQRVPEGEMRDQLIAQRAMFSLFEGDVATTRALTDPLLAQNDGPAYCSAALPAAMIRVIAGGLDDAIEVSTRAFEVRVALADTVQLGGPGVYLVAQALAFGEAGRIEQSRATAQFAYDAASADQNRNGIAWLAIALGHAHLLAGRLRTTMRFARESAMMFGELNHAGARWGYGLVALAAAQLGDAETAEEAMADIDAEPETTIRMMDSDIERARAWSMAARGDLPRARAAMRGAADDAHGRGLFTLEAALLHDIARLGDASAVAERIEALAAHVDGALMRARVRYATALAAEDAEGLERAAAEFEAIGANLFAAESANEAAIAHRKAGHSRPASATAQRAQSFAAQCEGARTPSLLHGTGTAVLTKREREVATLASHGLSSREIADGLFVSIRTVDNHLQHAYEKLGVAGRSDLADALTRAGY